MWSFSSTRYLQPSTPMAGRDNFTKGVRDILAHRAGFRCSKPDCRAPTAGPHEEDDKPGSIGIAAHITAAAEGGPRRDPSLSAEERSSARNGIWLCDNHAREIDKDPSRFTVEVLKAWKTHAEEEARALLGRSQRGTPLDVMLEVSLHRDDNDGLLAVGETNLPEGTKLMCSLRSSGIQYHAQVKGTVFGRRLLLGPFRRGEEPLPQRWYRLEICSYFNSAWGQSLAVLAIAGKDGLGLAGSWTRPLDPDLDDTDYAVDAEFDCPAPPLKEEAPLGDDETAGVVELVRKAVLEVEGQEPKMSAMPVGDVVDWFMSAPGLRKHEGWSSRELAPGIFEVKFSYWDGDKASEGIWLVMPRAKEVKYRNRPAKLMSWGQS